MDPKLVDLLKVELVLDDEAKASIVPGKSLIITFDLSHSGRRINNRIYPPRSHQATVDTWVKPFPKPILVHHDKTGTPLGRIIDVQWVSLEAEAINHIGDVASFLEVQAAFNSNQPKTIYKAMKKHGLLTDAKWPGVGKLVAKARITDSDAIQKFMDERYLTFSQSSRTNGFTCMVCGSKWHEGDVCEHVPGAVDEDGNMGLFMTGDLYGVEASVVNAPGDDLSIISSMELVDSEAPGGAGAWAVIQEDIMPTRSEIEVVDSLVLSDDQWEALLAMDVTEIAKAVFDDKLGFDFMDALKGRTHYEIVWLVRVHDALHMEYDWRIKNYPGEEGRELLVPEAVFKLHGDLHNLSSEKDFRDSFVNGELDKFGSDGSASTEYLSKKMKTSDEEKVEIEPEQEEEELTDGQEVQEQEEVQETQEEQEEVVDVDWYLLDAALGTEVETETPDAKLSSEARKKLPDSAFCGPDRSFPVHDCAHVTAARRLIGKAKLSDAQKKKVLACVDHKASKLGCDKSDSERIEKLELQVRKLQEERDKIKQDWLDALKTIESLNESLDNSDEECATLPQEVNVQDETDNKPVSEDEQNEIETEDTGKTLEDIEVVENPSGASSQGKPSAKKLSDLGDFEKRIVDQYKAILEQDGDEAAASYLRRNKKYLPRTFDFSILSS